MKARARSGLGAAALTKPGWRIVSALLKDERVLARIMHQLSNRLAAEASFDEAMPQELQTIGGFEDCYWLFSSNPLNHGLSRLEHDEAAYLFRLVKNLGTPESVEIGRFRGGSTFLLAAAGAQVLSIDIDGARFESDGPALVNALDRVGLRDRAQLVVADSRTYPVESSSIDLLFVDGDHSYDGVRTDFEHWWPALRPRGHLLLHDAEEFADTDPRRAISAGVTRLARQLVDRHDARRHQATGTLAHFSKLS